MKELPKQFEDKLPEKLHLWYLEAVKELHPESFNPNANKPYNELTDEQKFIDKYIAKKTLDFLTTHTLPKKEVLREVEIIKENSEKKEEEFKQSVMRAIEGMKIIEITAKQCKCCSARNQALLSLKKWVENYGK